MPAWSGAGASAGWWSGPWSSSAAALSSGSAGFSSRLVRLVVAFADAAELARLTLGTDDAARRSCHRDAKPHTERGLEALYV